MEPEAELLPMLSRDKLAPPDPSAKFWPKIAALRLVFGVLLRHLGPMSINELEVEALKLAPEDQARLLHKLALALDALEPEMPSNEELEKRWTDFEASGEKGIEAAQVRAAALKRYGLS